MQNETRFGVRMDGGPLFATAGVGGSVGAMMPRCGISSAVRRNGDMVAKMLLLPLFEGGLKEINQPGTHPREEGWEHAP